jgi:hypothetical protein
MATMETLRAIIETATPAKVLKWTGVVFVFALEIIVITFIIMWMAGDTTKPIVTITDTTTEVTTVTTTETTPTP